MRRRTTLYAAFTGADVPVFGVYDWNKKRLLRVMYDPHRHTAFVHLPRSVHHVVASLL